MAKKKMPKLDAYILLDRSGSMQDLWTEAVGSINAYVQELRERGASGKVTVATFDDSSFDLIRDAIPFQDFSTILTNESSPRGMTPLYDSTARLVDLANAKGTKKSVIVVMTDGYENCSREYNHSNIRKKLDSIKEKGWEAIFLGANFDVSHDAYKVGLGQNKFFKSSKKNLRSSMTDLATRSFAYAGGEGTCYAASASINYTTEDKQKAES